MRYYISKTKISFIFRVKMEDILFAVSYVHSLKSVTNLKK